MVAAGELGADADQQESDGDGGHSLGGRRAGGLLDGDPDEGDHISDDGRRVLGEHRSDCRVGGEHHLVEEVTTEVGRLDPQLAHGAEK